MIRNEEWDKKMKQAGHKLSRSHIRADVQTTRPRFLPHLYMRRQGLQNCHSGSFEALVLDI